MASIFVQQLLWPEALNVFPTWKAYYYYSADLRLGVGHLTPWPAANTGASERACIRKYNVYNKGTRAELTKELK